MRLQHVSNERHVDVGRKGDGGRDHDEYWYEQTLAPVRVVLFVSFLPLVVVVVVVVVDMHTCICAYMHPCIYAYTHMCTHTHIHTRHICIHAQTMCIRSS